MANKDLEITVSVEAALNKALHDVAKKLNEDYGLRIQRVEFEWVSISTVGTRAHLLKDVTVTASGGCNGK